MQHDLQLGRQALQQLRQRLEDCKAEKEASTKSCLAGVEAAQAQMLRMRAELKALKQAPDKDATEKQGEAIDEDEVHSRRQMQQVEARALRHELSKWRHQTSMLEAERPKQEAEVARLKAELANAEDVLESTRHAVRHLEVERRHNEPDSTAAPSGPPRLDKNGLPIGKDKGGRGNVEAVAERRVREKAEERGSQLSSKTKRLGQVLIAQQMLIQRLEKQILKEEGILETRELRLSGEAKLHVRLKHALRQRSDEIVIEKLLGKALGPKKTLQKVRQQKQQDATAPLPEAQPEDQLPRLGDA
jgi:hypothetical protein